MSSISFYNFNSQETRRAEYLLKDYILLTILLICASTDFPSISIGGMMFRLSWIILPFVYIAYFFRNKVEKKILILTLFFLVSAIPSIYISSNYLKSLFYFFWVFLNFFIYFSIFYSISQRIGLNVFRPIFWVSRFHILIGLFLFLIGIQDRPTSTFYEVSYLSIFLIPYITGLVFYRKYSNFFDYVLLAVFAVFSVSAAFLLILLTILFIYLIFYIKKNINNLSRLIILGFVFTFFAMGFLFYVQNVDDTNTRVLKVLLNGLSFDQWELIVMRGGNRYPRMIEAIEIIKSNWLFGTGLGSYEAYSSDIQLSRSWDHWIEIRGMPATNIWIEVFVTAGVLSFIIFSITSFYFFYKIFLISSEQIFWIYLAIIASIFLVMSFESTYMRSYLWCYLGMILGFLNLKIVDRQT